MTPILDQIPDVAVYDLPPLGIHYFPGEEQAGLDRDISVVGLEDLHDSGGHVVFYHSSVCNDDS